MESVLFPIDTFGLFLSTFSPTQEYIFGRVQVFEINYPFWVLRQLELANWTIMGIDLFTTKLNKL